MSAGRLKLRSFGILVFSLQILFPVTISVQGQENPQQSSTRVYKVKKGEHLYQILRDQFHVEKEQDIQSVLSEVKALNPGKKNWDVLLVGEKLVLPARGEPREQNPPFAEKRPTSAPASVPGGKLPARANVLLLEQILVAVGNETMRTGQEVLSVAGGEVRIDRATYPVVRNPQVGRKVILDLDSTMPRELRQRIETSRADSSIVPLQENLSLDEAVHNLMSPLGFQFLPADRPVVIRDQGISVELKGEWMVTAPDAGPGGNELFIVALTDTGRQTPDYLKEYLAEKGVKLRELFLTSPFAAPADSESQLRPGGSPVLIAPADKGALVDAILGLYDVPISTDRLVSLPLRNGISVDAKVDRWFEAGGKKVALFFHPIGDEMRKALQAEDSVKPIELDFQSLSSRDVVARLLESVGEKTTYREQRWPVSEGRSRDEVVLTLSGFFLPQRSLLVTDKQIPKALDRFFADRGVRVIYFH